VQQNAGGWGDREEVRLMALVLRQGIEPGPRHLHNPFRPIVDADLKLAPTVERREGSPRGVLDLHGPLASSPRHIDRATREDLLRGHDHRRARHVTCAKRLERLG